MTGRNSANLLYVPDVSSPTADSRVLYAPNFDFIGFQNFIENSELEDYQGEIAPKNIARTPWVHKLDLSFRQEIPFFLGGKLELRADVENVLNLIDSSWGTIEQVGFPYNAPVVNVRCLTTPGNAASVATSSAQPCAQYLFENRTPTFAQPIEATQINGSLWGVRFGVRLAF